jgi:DNA-binding MarR family transcriptional regulator
LTIVASSANYPDVKLPRSTFELLFRAARIVNATAVMRVQGAGGALRTAHTQLFPHISSDGIRLTELAARVGVSKQAIGPLVDDLVSEGMIGRVDDPIDRRAKLIRWTRKGERAMLHGINVLGTLEQEVGRRIGKKRLAELADTCEALIELLDEPVELDAP